VNYTTIIYEKTDKVAIITLNRPEKKNVINRQLSRELIKAFDEAEKDVDVGAVILTGGSECFCAGADLSEVQTVESGEPPVEPGMMEKIRYLPKPTIAAIGGHCVAGGLELAMACDIRIASETARIGDGHIKMGLIGPAGGVAILPRLVGAGMGKELVFTGDFIDGNEACRIGLANHVYPKDKFLNEALELANRIVKNPPTALRLSKRAIDVGLQMNESEAVHYSVLCQEEVLASAEFKERVAKFLKKE
jgi:enoyl-CoA hydratase/carnithine racemase